MASDKASPQTSDEVKSPLAPDGELGYCQQRIIPDLKDFKTRVLRLSDYEANYHLWQQPIPEGATVETLSAEHQSLTQEWRSSSAYQEHKNLFFAVVLAQSKLKISSSMCLGLGSLNADGCGNTPGPGFENHSMAQLVAFESWIELLGTKYKLRDVYFQDPEFNALDRAFLESRGYVIINTPESEAYLGEETFLYTPGAEWAVCMSSLNVPNPPALFITRDLTRQAAWKTRPAQLDHHEHMLDISDMLPARNRPERQLIQSYLNERAVKPLPCSDSTDWMGADFVYYLPDLKEDIKPAEFEFKDEELHDRFSDEELYDELADEDF